jgi:hypothetical protein
MSLYQNPGTLALLSSVATKLAVMFEIVCVVTTLEISRSKVTPPFATQLNFVGGCDLNLFHIGSKVTALQFKFNSTGRNGSSPRRTNVASQFRQFSLSDGRDLDLTPDRS